MKYQSLSMQCEHNYYSAASGSALTSSSTTGRRLLQWYHGHTVKAWWSNKFLKILLIELAKLLSHYYKIFDYKTVLSWICVLNSQQKYHYLSRHWSMEARRHNHYSTASGSASASSSTTGRGVVFFTAFPAGLAVFLAAALLTSTERFELGSTWAEETNGIYLIILF